MKKLLLIALILLSGYLSAQEQYIEVVVTDTMTIEPKEWNYFLVLQKTDETTATTAGQPKSPAVIREEQQKLQIARRRILDSIRAVAINLGGEITGDPNNPLNFTMTPRSYLGNIEPQYINVKFTNRQAMESFIRAVNTRGDIEGRITATGHPDLPPFTDQLYARIVSNARKKAANLAQLANRTLGAVILVSEVAEPDMSPYQNLFEKMMEADRTSWLPGWHTQSPDYPTDKIKLQKTLRLRFAIQ